MKCEVVREPTETIHESFITHDQNREHHRGYLRHANPFSVAASKSLADQSRIQCEASDVSKNVCTLIDTDIGSTERQSLLIDTLLCLSL